MITSIDAEKALEKNPTTFMIKTLSKLGMEGNLLNLIRLFFKNLQITSYLIVRGLKLFHYDELQGQDVHSHLSFSKMY